MKSIIVLMLVLLMTCFCSTDISSQKISARVYKAELTGYIQHPDPIDGLENTVIVWEKPVNDLAGLNKGTKIILSQSVLDTLESQNNRLTDFQFKKVTIVGIFQKFPDGTIYCIEILNLVDYELLSETALEAEKNLERLTLLIEGYIDLGPSSLLIYKNRTGDEFIEEVKFDDKTLWLNIPQGKDFVNKLVHDKRKVRIKVGWRQPESFEAVNGGSISSGNYIAGYINISVLE